jgi:iron(III) transport system ATP-binding protein
VLEITDLHKTYPARRRSGEQPVAAVDGISLVAEQGQVFTMLGPSGCGKTTTLRCIAGLENPDTGRITVEDRVLYCSEQGIRLRANQRGLGMVFQSYAVWPHMDVFGNVAFPLQVAPRGERLGRKEIAERVERVLDVVQLDHLASRPATDLSGGQQQRLALARALVMQPPLLLLDEPLSNLDAKLRESMRFELKRLQRDLGITAVYVTHDQVEALAMSNQIAVMAHGRIQQIGHPRAIYEHPETRFVADFIGSSTFIDGQVAGAPVDGLVEVRTDVGPLLVTTAAVHPVGERVTVAIRPEHIGLAEADPFDPAPGTAAGKVLTRAFMGEAVDHVVDVGGLEVRIRCTASISLAPGTSVAVTFPPERCSLLPPDVT